MLDDGINRDTNNATPTFTSTTFQISIPNPQDS